METADIGVGATNSIMSEEIFMGPKTLGNEILMDLR